MGEEEKTAAQNALLGMIEREQQGLVKALDVLDDPPSGKVCDGHNRLVTVTSQFVRSQVVTLECLKALLNKAEETHKTSVADARTSAAGVSTVVTALIFGLDWVRKTLGA